MIDDIPRWNLGVLRTPQIGNGGTGAIYRITQRHVAKILLDAYLDRFQEADAPATRRGMSIQQLSWEHSIAAHLREHGVNAVRTYGVYDIPIRTGPFGIGRITVLPGLLMEYVTGDPVDHLPVVIRHRATELLEKELGNARALGYEPSWSAQQPEGNALYDRDLDSVTLLDFAFWDERRRP